MARKVITIVECDRCGAELRPGTNDRIAFHYAIERALYETDLCEAHARDFDEALAPFTSVARPIRQTKSNLPKRDPRSAEIRAWAAQHGIDVSPKGRIPEAVRQQYLEAVGSAA